MIPKYPDPLPWQTIAEEVKTAAISSAKTPYVKVRDVARFIIGHETDFPKIMSPSGWTPHQKVERRNVMIRITTAMDNYLMWSLWNCKKGGKSGRIYQIPDDLVKFIGMEAIPIT